MSDQSDISDAIVDSATSPKSVSVDGQSVTQQSVTEQIVAVKFLAANSAIASGGDGITRRRSKPPGASGLHS